MDQRCRVYQFRRHGERYDFFRIGWMKLGSEDRQRRTNPLAAALDQQFENLGERRELDAQRIPEPVFDRL